MNCYCSECQAIRENKEEGGPMIEIRKKHEADVKYSTPRYQSSLTVAEVDALFAALEEYHILCQGHVLAQKQWKEELDEAKDIIRKSVEWVQDEGEDKNDLMDILMEGAGNESK